MCGQAAPQLPRNERDPASIRLNFAPAQRINQFFPISSEDLCGRWSTGPCFHTPGGRVEPHPNRSEVRPFHLSGVAFLLPFHYLLPVLGIIRITLPLSFQ
jgi:hypothetical protein